jgi:tetratricopeptide (TPR) repeat protein
VETRLSSPAARFTFLAALIVSAAILTFEAVRIWIAETHLESADPVEMEKGVRLVPGDADAWDRLGRYYLLSFTDPNIPLAVTDFRRAVDVDPLSENYWLDLASAYDASGDEESAQDAYAHARGVYPTSALVAWNYGNFLLREDKNDEGYAEIQKAVVGNPLLLPLAMSRVWHATADVNQLLDHVIPANVDAYVQALNFFGSIHQMQAGLVVWSRLAALKQPIRLAVVFPFIEELVREDDSDDARRMWNEATLASGDAQLALANDSVVSDGSFDAAFPYGGLGWNWESTQGAVINFDSSTPNGKGRSVRVDFSGGANLTVVQPSEYIAVAPATAYHFHAAMRTDDVTTDSGLRFDLHDPNHNAPNIQTENFTGTHPWTNLDLDVQTGPQTHFLLLRLYRAPSTFFENKLGGTVWITDISLAPASSATSQARK